MEKRIKVSVREKNICESERASGKKTVYEDNVIIIEIHIKHSKKYNSEKFFTIIKKMLE